jgi:hypothetical protein
MNNGSIKWNNVLPLFAIKHDTSCFGCVVESLCQGKRCGFATICIFDEVLLAIKENLRKKGISICRRISSEDVSFPFN